MQRLQVDWLRSNPLFDNRTAVTGWVYEVETGRLREVPTSARDLGDGTRAIVDRLKDKARVERGEISLKALRAEEQRSA